MKFQYFDENSSNQIYHFGDLGYTDQFDQLYFFNAHDAEKFPFDFEFSWPDACKDKIPAFKGCFSVV